MASRRSSRAFREAPPALGTDVGRGLRTASPTARGSPRIRSYWIRRRRRVARKEPARKAGASSKSSPWEYWERKLRGGHPPYEGVRDLDVRPRSGCTTMSGGDIPRPRKHLAQHRWKLLPLRAQRTFHQRPDARAILGDNAIDSTGIGPRSTSETSMSSTPEAGRAPRSRPHVDHKQN